MSISSKIKTIFRGDVRFRDLPREALRRKRVADRRKIERRNLDQINALPARFKISGPSPPRTDIATHFRERDQTFFTDLGDPFARLHTTLFPDETTALVEAAGLIVRESSWELAGFGVLKFTGENIWRTDPLGNKDWGTDYHPDVAVFDENGPDIRILWELNRFGQAVTLAQAFALTGDEAYALAVFSQVDAWMKQNPYGRGANWNCAMEAALRAVNLLAAFDILRHSTSCTDEQMARLLQFFDQHGRFIRDNDEFSYVTTSNHYLSDVVGLFWIGTMLPELACAAEWRAFGLSEMLREMDKQVLPDGADFEASTGYHKFVTEMFLFSFVLARRNNVSVPERYWTKLRGMLEYISGIMRPDGRMPLIGDADGSQIVPVVKRDSDDAGYLLALGSIVFDDPQLKQGVRLTPEILWLCGEKGVETFTSLAAPVESGASAAFSDGGAYVMRDGDLYMHLNANDCGVNGRGSHAHNDALSFELSAYGQEYIIDPGSYVYNLDRAARHLFRSTAYHSTVTVDDVEQNSMRADLPFVMGNEARPTVLKWETGSAVDRVSAKHSGYMRLSDSIAHRRDVEFNKTDKFWLIKDILNGSGEHNFSFSFHIAPGLTIGEIADGTVQIDAGPRGCLLLKAEGIIATPNIVDAWRSVSYGHRERSQIVRWTLLCAAPLTARFLLVPVAPGERLETRLALIERLTQNTDS